MRVFLLMLMISLSLFSCAQSRFSYTAGMEANFIRGDNDKSFAFLFNNGVRYKTTMAGLGGGIDGYRFRSVPFYLYAKQLFGQNHWQPFVEASAGINFHNLTTEQKQLYNWYSGVNFNDGFFAKASAGLSVAIHRSFHVFTSAGYSYKATKVTYGSYSVSPGVPPNTMRNIYRMNRWCLSAGFWF